MLVEKTMSCIEFKDVKPGESFAIQGIQLNVYIKLMQTVKANAFEYNAVNVESGSPAFFNPNSPVYNINKYKVVEC